MGRPLLQQMCSYNNSYKYNNNSYNSYNSYNNINSNSRTRKC